METKQLTDNEVIADPASRRIIEVFMGYADGYLGQKIRWNDIMPVVEKIENLDISTKIECNGISTTVTIGHISVWQNPSTRIEKVYKAVLEFIHWYNQNSKS